MPDFVTEPDSKALPVQIAPGIAALSPVSLKVSGWDGYDLELTVKAVPADGDRTGRFVCSQLVIKQVDDEALVTTEALRAIPVSTLLRGVGSRVWNAVDSSDENSMVMADRRLDDETVKRFHREGPTDEVLLWVARSYRMALVLGDPPTKAVETSLELTRSTAGRWVSLAREKGYLAPSEGPGKAGG